MKPKFLSLVSRDTRGKSNKWDSEETDEFHLKGLNENECIWKGEKVEES